jgi:hypothetical protein
MQKTFRNGHLAFMMNIKQSPSVGEHKETSRKTYRGFDIFTVTNILIVVFLVMLGHLTDGY